MSFFEEDVESRRRTSRPRRAAPPGRPASDQQTLLVRRGVALAAGLLLLLLLLFLISSCRSSVRENGLKDYNREVASIARESETQVGRPFFSLFSGSSGSARDVQTGVAGLRTEADAQLDRAEKIDTPDEMTPAQRSLLIVLELRRDGLEAIARRVRTAVGDQGDAADEANTAIAGQMQSFLASDVLHRARVQPLIKSALDRAEIGGQDIPGSRFLNDVAWLAPRTIASRLGGGGGDATGSTEREPTPGLHGSGLQSVSVGDTRLDPSGANRIPAAAGAAPTFDVAFINQGESDEQDVRVDVRVAQRGGGPSITGSDTVDSVAQGATATASVRLPRAPAAGAALTITVRVRPVPGEKKTDNNEQEYQALFTE